MVMVYDFRDILGLVLQVLLLVQCWKVVVCGSLFVGVQVELLVFGIVVVKLLVEECQV